MSTVYKEYILQPNELFDSKWEGYNPGSYTDTSVKCRVKREGIGPSDLKPLSEDALERLKKDCREVTYKSVCEELMEKYGLRSGKLVFKLNMVSISL